MYIDFKIATWERIYIKDESLKDKIVAALKSGEITHADDVFDFNTDREIFHEDSQQMSIYDNDGFSTIIAYDDEDTILYQNGI
jgi:hypothetical protein